MLLGPKYPTCGFRGVNNVWRQRLIDSFEGKCVGYCPELSHTITKLETDLTLFYTIMRSLPTVSVFQKCSLACETYFYSSHGEFQVYFCCEN